MALFWRIWVAVTLVNLAVLCVFVGLATLQFGVISSGLVGERLAVLAGRTAAPFEAAARIGLPISTVRNAKALLERARQTDDAILAVHVFDADGKIVHSTDPAATAIPAEALLARAQAEGAPWHREIAGRFVSGIDIAGREGKTAGGVLVVYPDTGSVTRIRAMTAELALAAIVVLLAAAALAVPLLRFGLKRQIRTFEAVDGAIGAFERRSWRSAAAAAIEPEADAGETDELRRLLDEAEACYRATGRKIAAVAEDAQ